MRMNLVVDFGNTSIKAALFREAELLQQQRFSSLNELLNADFPQGKIQRAMFASVTKDHLDIIEHWKDRFPIVVFGSTSKIPLINRYKSPETLGSDRLLCALGAYTLFPNTHVLSIDAGTCLKYNLVNKQNEFLGGAISPGIPMRLKAMHHYTSALPQLEPDPEFNQPIGDDTRSSMLSGAILGAVAEVEELIRVYRTEFPDLKVLITGGDAPYLCKRLKSTFFANPNLLLLGLNAALNYSLEK